MIYDVIRSRRDQDDEVVERGLTLDAARHKAEELSIEYSKANPEKTQWTRDLFTIRLDKKLMEATPEMLKALEAACNALRSYQYGNAATGLAQEIADHCDEVLRKARGAA